MWVLSGKSTRTPSAWNTTTKPAVRGILQDAAHRTVPDPLHAPAQRTLHRREDGQNAERGRKGQQQPGAAAGEVASGLAADAFLQNMDNCWKERFDGVDFKARLLEAYTQANEVVYDASRTNEDYAGMGTTMVCALCGDNQAIIGNVGDSRAYRVNSDGIWQMTRDHSLVQMMVERGELTPELARTYPGKNFITRAIGTEPVVECDLVHTTLEKGDCLLLCSDGLSNMMDDQEILFEVVHGVNKQQCCQRLLDIAKNRGAPDNVTSILIQI